MNKIIFHIVFCFMVFASLNTYAQNPKPNSDNKIALQYYRNGEFEKAAEVYSNLYKANPSQVYFRYYLNCLVKLEQYNEAEDLCKTQVKRYKFQLNYLVDLGYVYQLKGQESKAKSTYQSAIKKLNADQHQAIGLANAFMSKRLFDYAEQTYLHSKKLLNGAYGFQMELAQLYYYQRNYQKMIDEYLDLLAVNEQYVQTVQNRLQNAIYNDIDDSLKKMLSESLLVRLRNNPENIVFSELLLWLYIQEKNFYGALIQAKALDTRLAEDGKRLIALARIAADNNDFGTAIEAYEYVIAKGKHINYYYIARNEMLDVMFKRIDLGLDAKREDFERLEESYISAIQELGSKPENVHMIKNLAHVQAFYLDKTTEAWFLLEDAVKMRGLDRKTQGELELELGDIYLASGKVWDATFAYARVEENNKHNPVGSEAKYRKAKLAYYIGDFEWSMAQLDVLKGSTSKLIANDAAYLSLFIFDNTGWDSVETALETYSRADLLYYQSKDSLALLTLDSVLTLFPHNELADDVWYMKAKIYQENQRFDLAEEAYLKIINDYGFDILGDKSMYALAYLYENELERTEDAKDYYKRLLVEYAGSVYTVEARKRFRTLRGDAVVN